MKKQKSTQPVRTALIYVTFGVLWIILTDSALGLVFQNSHQEYAFLQTIKGWLFVCASALLIYLVLRRDVQTLAESEQRYKLLFDNNPNPMWVYAVETLRFLTVNDAAIAHYGYTREEFLAMTIKEIRPEEEVSTLMENISTETTSLQRSGGWKHRKKDGTLIDVEIDSHALWFDNRNARLVMANDITKRKTAAEQLAYQAELLSNVHDAIVGTDADFRITYWNKTAEEIFGWTEQEALGQETKELFKTKVPGSSREEMVKQLMTTGQFDGEVLYARKDGVYINADVRAVALKDKHNNIKGVLSSIRDITERKQSEIILRRNENILQESQSIAKLGSWTADLTAGLFYLSPEAALLIGRAAGVHQLEELLEAVHPEDRETVQSKWTEALRGAAYDIEYRTSVNGATHWLHATAKITFNTDGQPLSAIGTLQDITERKHAEEALKVSEENYRSLVETSDNAIAVLDREGKILYANPAGIRIWDDPQLIGKTIHDLYPQELADRYLVVIRKVIDDQIVDLNEVKSRIKDRLMWFRVSMTPLKNNDGSINALLLNAWDITERRQTEEQLRTSEERFRQLAENIEDGFWITDPHTGREIYLSPAIEKIWGRSIEEILKGRNVFLDSILEEDKPRVLAELEKQKLGNRTDMEYRIHQPNGTVRWVWDRAFPIVAEDGQVKLVTGLTSDITERKQATENLQTQLERLKALSAIDNVISASMDMRLTLDIFIREAVAQLKVDAAGVLLMNKSLLTLEYAAGCGFRSLDWAQEGLKLGQGLGGRAALKRQRIHIPNLAKLEDELIRSNLHESEGFITYFGIPLIAKGQVKGVLEVFHRSELDPDPDWLDYLDTLAGQAAIAIEIAQLFENIQRSNFELIMAYDATIAGWSHAMDLRDKETEGHTQRVTEMTIQLAERMGVSKQEQVQIRRGALLHDIGKLGVPDHILLKPGKLTDEEWALMRQHPTHAYEMLLPIHYLRPALDIPYCHHEKWDGSGYPRGLKDEGIPLAARIFAVVDVWDALRSDRPYRDGWSAQKTRDYILAESGKHFDPQVVIEFMQMLDEMSDVVNN
ncbi:MAG: PAS domain S-box protein [Anaerolineales bacterium]|nr:PAS domain S-box protein [Anaerolineales bacterium]